MTEAQFESDFVAKLAKLNETMQSIQSVSLWLVFHRARHARIHAIWRAQLLSCERERANEQHPHDTDHERPLFVASSPRQLLLLYLANDVLQASRKKGTEFTTSFQSSVVSDVAAIHANGDAATRAKVERVIQVWLERAVFPAEVVAALRAAISVNASAPFSSLSLSPPTTSTASFGASLSQLHQLQLLTQPQRQPSAFEDDDDDDAYVPQAPEQQQQQQQQLAPPDEPGVADDVRLERLLAQVRALGSGLPPMPTQRKMRSHAGLTRPQLVQRVAKLQARTRTLERIADAVDARCTRRDAVIAAAQALVARQTQLLDAERRAAVAVKRWIDDSSNAVERISNLVALAVEYEDEDEDGDPNDKLDASSEASNDDAAIQETAQTLMALEQQALQSSDALTAQSGGDGAPVMDEIARDLEQEFGEEDFGASPTTNKNKRARVMI